MTDRKKLPPQVPGLSPLEDSRRLATDTPLTEEVLAEFIDKKTDALVELFLARLGRSKATDTDDAE